MLTKGDKQRVAKNKKESHHEGPSESCGGFGTILGAK